MQPGLWKMCPNYYNEAKKFHAHCPHPTSSLRKACSSFIGNPLAPVNSTLVPFLPAEGPATVSLYTCGTETQSGDVPCLMHDIGCFRDHLLSFSAPPLCFAQSSYYYYYLIDSTPSPWVSFNCSGDRKAILSL